MKRKILLNLGILSAIALGAFGTTLAVVDHLKHTVHNSKFDNLNDSLDDINNSYDNAIDNVEINASNIIDVNSLIAKNFEHLVDTIENSNNDLIKIFSNDIKTKLEMIKNTFNSKQELTLEELAKISTIMINLTTQHESLMVKQEEINLFAQHIDKKYQIENIALSESIINLETILTSITNGSSITNEKIIELQDSIESIRNKVFLINQLQTELSSLQLEVGSIIDEFQKIINKTTSNSYNITTLTKKIINLETENTNLVSDIIIVKNNTNIIEKKVNDIASITQNWYNILLQGNVVQDKALSTLKLNVEQLKNNQNKIKNEQKGIKTNIHAIQTKLENVFDENKKLKSDMEYLFTQNKNLNIALTKLETALKEQSNSLVTKSTTTVLLPNKVLYDHPKHHIDFADFAIPNLNIAKNIAIDLKIEDTTFEKGHIRHHNSSPYIVRIIDAYPTKGNSIIGTAMSMDGHQFLLNISITKNSIIFHGLLYKTMFSYWKNIKRLKNKRIIINAIQIVY